MIGDIKKVEWPIVQKIIDTRCDMPISREYKGIRSRWRKDGGYYADEWRIAQNIRDTSCDRLPSREP